MNSILLLEAIGCLDDDLLERSEKKGKRKVVSPVVRWVSLAACLCLICIAVWSVASPPKMAEDSAESNNMVNDMKTEDFLIADSVEEAEGSVELLYRTQYIRVGVSDDDVGADGLQITVINNRTELDKYIADNSVSLDTSGFMTACQEYGQTFFAHRQLILLNVLENSGSITHSVVDLCPPSNDSDAWTIVLGRSVPLECTDDMACWQILLEVDAGLLGSEEVIEVEIKTLHETTDGKWESREAE